MSDELTWETEYLKPVAECKGLFYRGFNSSYVDSKGTINLKSGYRLLKRKSCSGCPSCSFIKDCIREQAFVPTKYILDGGLYTVKVTNISRDWETGYVDDFDIEFTEVRETPDYTLEISIPTKRNIK